MMDVYLDIHHIKKSRYTRFEIFLTQAEFARITYHGPDLKIVLKKSLKLINTNNILLTSGQQMRNDNAESKS